MLTYMFAGNAVDDSISRGDFESNWPLPKHPDDNNFERSNVANLW
jgi:hypothetical protein